MDNDPIFALKRQLGTAIVALAEPLPMIVAARRLGIDQARLSDLRRGRFQRFSLDRLIRILNTVDRSVNMEVVQTRPGKINWTPKLTEWRKNYPLSKLRLAEGEWRRARNRELERRLRDYPSAPDADRIAAQLDADFDDEIDGKPPADDGMQHFDDGVGPDTSLP